MKTYEKDKDILRGIMKQGIQSPEGEDFNKRVLDRLYQEKASADEPGALKFTLPAILLMVLSFIFIFTTLMTPVIDKLAEKSGLFLIEIVEGLLVDLTSLIYNSPAFVLVFAAIFLLYKLDRFLGRQTYSTGR